jgi:osmotically-inducible protein OsmY
VDVRDGEVFLTGTVENLQSKRRAEDIGQSVSGVRNVENSLRIRMIDTDGGNLPG